MTPAETTAKRLLQEGHPDQAEQLLRQQLTLTPQDAPLRTLLAQVLVSRGRKDEALDELQRVVAQAPAVRAPRLLLARLANELRRAALAAQHARALVDTDAGDSEAWSALGFAAFALGRRHEAREALRRAVSLAPAYAAARYNLALVLCEQEQSEEALAEAEEAVRLGSRRRGATVVRAKALMQLDRLDEAGQVLGTLLAEHPADAEIHGVLVQLRQLRGDADPLLELRAAAAASGATPALRMALADALRRRGELAAAEEALHRLIAECGREPPLLMSVAAVLQEGGRMSEAFSYSREARAAAPDDAAIAENFVVSALGSGNAGEALPVVEGFRASQPRDQRWITYRIDIARLRREPAFDAWFDPGRLARSFDLPAPPGYRDRREFHTALGAVLGARHRQGNHPLDQSLRHGTQTSRNLLVRPEPEVAQLLAGFEEALAQYQREMGSDGLHPLSSRNSSPARLVGCWSVRLRRGGFHVNHIHPEGWLSSAYYVNVPDEVSDPDTQAGWLKFGEPRFPIAGLDPLMFVQPVEGRLVLFPSYLWHGTTPLRGDAPRMSVAFDALPQAEIH